MSKLKRQTKNAHWEYVRETFRQVRLVKAFLRSPSHENELDQNFEDLLDYLAKESRHRQEANNRRRVFLQRVLAEEAFVCKTLGTDRAGMCIRHPNQFIFKAPLFETIGPQDQKMNENYTVVNTCRICRSEACQVDSGGHTTPRHQPAMINVIEEVQQLQSDRKEWKKRTNILGMMSSHHGNSTRQRICPGKWKPGIQIVEGDDESSVSGDEFGGENDEDRMTRKEWIEFARFRILQVRSWEDRFAIKNHPIFCHYFKMLQFGVPIEAVKHDIESDGYHPSLMDLIPNRSLELQLDKLSKEALNNLKVNGVLQKTHVTNKETSNEKSDTGPLYDTAPEDDDDDDDTVDGFGTEVSIPDTIKRFVLAFRRRRSNQILAAMSLDEETQCALVERLRQQEASLDAGRRDRVSVFAVNNRTGQNHVIKKERDKLPAEMKQDTDSTKLGSKASTETKDVKPGSNRFDEKILCLTDLETEKQLRPESLLLESDIIEEHIDVLDEVRKNVKESSESRSNPVQLKSPAPETTTALHNSLGRPENDTNVHPGRNESRTTERSPKQKQKRRYGRSRSSEKKVGNNKCNTDPLDNAKRDQSRSRRSYNASEAPNGQDRERSRSKSRSRNLSRSDNSERERSRSLRSPRKLTKQLDARRKLKSAPKTPLSPKKTANHLGDNEKRTTKRSRSVDLVSRSQTRQSENISRLADNKKLTSRDSGTSLNERKLGRNGSGKMPRRKSQGQGHVSENLGDAYVDVTATLNDTESDDMKQEKIVSQRRLGPRRHQSQMILRSPSNQVNLHAGSTPDNKPREKTLGNKRNFPRRYKSQTNLPLTNTRSDELKLHHYNRNTKIPTLSKDRIDGKRENDNRAKSTGTNGTVFKDSTQSSTLYSNGKILNTSIEKTRETTRDERNTSKGIPENPPLMEIFVTDDNERDTPDKPRSLRDELEVFLRGGISATGPEGPKSSTSSFDSQHDDSINNSDSPTHELACGNTETLSTLRIKYEEAQRLLLEKDALIGKLYEQIEEKCKEINNLRIELTETKEMNSSISSSRIPQCSLKMHRLNHRVKNDHATSTDADDDAKLPQEKKPECSTHPDMKRAYGTGSQLSGKRRSTKEPARTNSARDTQSNITSKSKITRRFSLDSSKTEMGDLNIPPQYSKLRKKLSSSSITGGINVVSKPRRHASTSSLTSNKDLQNQRIEDRKTRKSNASKKIKYDRRSNDSVVNGQVRRRSYENDKEGRTSDQENTNDISNYREVLSKCFNKVKEIEDNAEYVDDTSIDSLHGEDASLDGSADSIVSHLVSPTKGRNGDRRFEADSFSEQRDTYYQKTDKSLSQRLSRSPRAGRKISRGPKKLGMSLYGQKNESGNRNSKTSHLRTSDATEVNSISDAKEVIFSLFQESLNSQWTLR